MSLYWPYVGADYFAVLEIQTAIVAVIILVSSIDDLFVDAWFWVREIYRAIYVWPKYRALTARQLRRRNEQPIAIMVPAWHEYDVIAAMIENMVRVLEYRSYVIFVGTYVNDIETIAEVERIERRYGQLVRVEVPHPGPTCKADCLNWIVQAIFLHERQNEMEFVGVVLHDSEDVLHPLELKYFNYLLPRKDLIQVPVMSLEREWYELVAGVYMDEFAEWHAKDLVVRESVAGAVPSAGVGTCFSRRALLVLAAETDNQPFNTASLTEDYDIGARLALHGMKSIIARFPVQFRVMRKTWFGYGPEREIRLRMPLCVREYFPDTFRTSYRQKARWTLGIGLQSWALIGWQGSLANRYLLMRDRKGIVTSLVAMFAYVVALQFVVLYLLALLGLWNTRYPAIFAPDSWLTAVLVANAVALVLRVVQRFYFVNRLYGWENGLMSIPRLVVGNFVNFWAVCRAWKLFLSSVLFDTPVVWDKTMHDFPSTDALRHKRQRLGELLVAWQAVDEEALEHALVKQEERQLPLGRYLVLHGWLDDEMLAEAIAYQANLPRASVSAELINTHSEALPSDLCVRLRALPIGRSETGQTLLAVANPLDDVDLAEVRDALGHEPLQQIARESEIADGLRLVRGDSDAFDRDGDNAVPLLGDVLIESGLVEPEALDAALEDYRPSQHGRIGDFLVQRGVVSRESLLHSIAEQQRQFAGFDGQTETNRGGNT